MALVATVLANRMLNKMVAPVAIPSPLPFSQPGPYAQLYYTALAEALVGSVPLISALSTANGISGTPGVGTFVGVPGYQPVAFSAILLTQMWKDGLKPDPPNAFTGSGRVMLALVDWIDYFRLNVTTTLSQLHTLTVSTGASVLSTLVIDPVTLGNMILGSLVAKGFGNLGVLPDESVKFHRAYATAISTFMASFPPLITVPIAGGVPTPPGGIPSPPVPIVGNFFS